MKARTLFGTAYLHLAVWRILLVLVGFLILIQTSEGNNGPFLSPTLWMMRGGATPKTRGSKQDNVYKLLAKALIGNFEDVDDKSELSKAFERLSTSQQAFKGLDGAAHEVYQRTHAGDDIDISVVGRAQRSAARTAATAEALLACELIELVQSPDVTSNETLRNRKVLLNITTESGVVTMGKGNLSVLVLWEEKYTGGAGLDHGNIEHLTDEIIHSPRQLRRPRGRLLIILGDPFANDLVKTLQVLDQSPQRVKLSSGLVIGEVVSVQSTLYGTAGSLLKELEPILRSHNASAVHFVGSSLAGGVASLAACIFDGTLPMPKRGKASKKRSGSKRKTPSDESTIADIDAGNKTMGNNETEVLQPLDGLGRGRSSALTLGAPPCLSSNILAAYCTSFMYGDDIVCRTSRDSIQRLCKRAHTNIHGGIIGRNVGWMADALSLTVSNLKTHAHGSEGEEAKLSVPGRAYLLRPRRLGGVCSIHEVGSLKKGGREALRAGLLWQLNDILLSKSMWKHHFLDSYIHGLDRVQLRGIDNEEDYY